LGLGINVNQIKWASDIPNPISLSILNNQEQDLHKVLNGTLSQIQKSVESFNSKNQEKILGAFNKGLWRRGKDVSYATEGKATEQGILLGVNTKGQIQVTHTSGIKSFHLGEVRLLPG
jgi:BirA family biotin operon repressor/biotin-[acetyl-CoA-carboxylase] ligase